MNSCFYHSREYEACLRKPCFLLVFIMLSLFPLQAAADKCLYISSYHKGYAWSDGVERGLRSVLEDTCQLRQFDMDTKRNKSEDFKKKAASKAKEIIDNWMPDVVITADDNAAKYVIMEHYKDHTTPFVFCGVNWTAEEYGFPYNNVTGIIEVAPIRPLLEKVKQLIPTARRALYIGANTLTEEKNYNRFVKAADRHSLDIESALVGQADDWIRAYAGGQEYDFIIIGSNAGIKDWNEATVVKAILKDSRNLSITSHGWMMPYSMLGFTKVPEEQGELAGNIAISILNGTDISRIAIVPNRKWDIWINPQLLQTGGITLPKGLIAKSKQIQ